MSVSIGSNLAARSVIRQLDTSSNRLAATFERLSTGARINHASDDAAGLSVSMSLGVQGRILSRAQRNISDGLSLLSIADGVLGESASILARMAELAEQAANGSYSGSQRKQLDTEFQQLDREMRRLESSTSFNGLSLLKGEKSSNGAQLLGVDGAASGMSQKAISRNGSYAVYADSNNSLYLVNLETHDTTSLQSVLAGLDSSVGANGGGRIAITDAGDVYFESTSALHTNVFRLDHNMQTLTQLTNTQNFVDMGGWTISADQSTFAFLSSTIYENGGTANSAQAGGFGQFYWYFLDTDTGKIRADSSQLLSSTNSAFLSSDGRYFASVNGATVNVAALNSTSFTASSFTTGASTPTVLGIQNSGSVIFRSTQNLTGDNPNTLSQYFSYDIQGHSYRQLTNFSTSVSVGAEALSADGTRISFVSAKNLTGENSALQRQVFTLDLTTSELRQNTNYGSNFLSGYANFLLSGDGSRLTALDSTDGSTFSMFDLRADAAQFDLEVGQGNGGGILAQFDGLLRAVRGFGGLTLTSTKSSRQALDQVRSNIATLSQARGSIGTSQSRLETALQLLSSQTTELEGARSRITDVDIGAESANVTRLQILQQTGAALLAQANQAPALALTLLRV